MSKSNKTYLLRMSDEQHARLTARANANGMSINGYLLHAAIGETPVTPGAYTALATEVTTLRNAMEISGMNDAITTARAMLEE